MSASSLTVGTFGWGSAAATPQTVSVGVYGWSALRVVTGGFLARPAKKRPAGRKKKEHDDIAIIMSLLLGDSLF